MTKAKVFRIVIILAVAVVLLVPVINLLQSPSGAGPLAASAESHPGFARAAKALGENCMDCHAPGARLPFYAGLPGAAGVIQADIRRGTRWMNMEAELAPSGTGPGSEASLAKLEHSVQRNLMPPARYRWLHWDRTLGGEERGAILDWIRESRLSRYEITDLPRDLQSGAIRPLPETVKVEPAKVRLGEMLFHDVRLSGDDTISCASCHALDKGGTDQLPFSVGIGGQTGPINSPTVFNSAFNILQFWDGRAADLKEQAAGPVHNPLEMGSEWSQVIPKLEEDGSFLEEFAAVYPDGLSGDAITDAIAEFERSLVTPNSPFDRYLHGESDALSAEESRGHQLFLDNGCGTCHVGAALGGRSFEIMGRNRDYFEERGNIQEVDYGRFNVTGEEPDRHRFKVPILRNVALTFPYFHDGSRTTLKEAVIAMADYQAYRPFDDAEAGSVASFLKSLTGEFRGEPLR